MAENYVLIQTLTLTQNAASVTFNNIPQTGFTDLKVVMSARSNYAATGSGAAMTFNGVSTGYSYRQLYGFSGGAGSVNGTSTGISFNITGANFTANSFESIELYIPNYTASTNKSISIDAVRSDTASAWQLDMFAYLWSNSAAISTITITENNSSTFVANSTFSLYGIAAAGTEPVNPTAPKATGGNVVISDNTYWYHIFTSSGTFAPSSAVSCDYVVIAGGGSGGSCPPGYNVGSGGGGAGGLRQTSSPVSFASGSYAVTIGAGATAPARGSGSQGNNGTNSSLIGGAISISATGGGGGGATQTTGNSGGSGGGGAQAYSGGSGNAGGYTPSEGNSGGSGNGGDPTFNAGGGGGAGGSGGNGVYGSPYTAGAGGIGATSALLTTIAQTSNLGVNGYFAAGGGGGTYAGSTVAVGGLGGGGNGCAGNTPATSGRANTGSGGGGDGGIVAGPGNGGSGIVVIRYAMA